MAAAFGLAAIFDAAALLVIVALIRTRKLVPQRAEVAEEEPAIAPGSTSRPARRPLRLSPDVTSPRGRRGRGKRPGTWFTG